MSRLKYFAAVGAAIAEEMHIDENVVLLGEDVGASGGIFAQTRGLFDTFGGQRVLDCPAGEAGFLGAAVGAAMTGARPIVELSFTNFFATCWDALVNQASKMRYMTGGQASVPLTIISFCGAGLNAGPQHSDSFEAWLGSIPGVKTLMPSTPLDVKSALKAAIRNDDPVIVLLHKALLSQSQEISDDGSDSTDPYRCAVRREGTDLTIVAWSAMVRTALAAADQLSDRGIEAEVVDLRSIQPLDVDGILASVERTGRLLIAQESPGFAGIGAEITAQVCAALRPRGLDVQVQRLSAPFSPVPYSPPLERGWLVSAEQITEHAAAMVSP